MRTVADRNVQVARQTFDAIGRRDIQGLLELYTPDSEFEPLTGLEVESRGSGALADNPMAWVLTVRDGEAAGLED
jgi:ketosteroid isomerase-like protein